MIDFSSFAQESGRILDAAGIVVILAGVVIATIAVIVAAFQHKKVHELYQMYRHNLARSILIGLEFLVAGDIIRSVAGNLSFDSVIILAIIVIIRSMLGVEFEMEIEGHWPWHRKKLKEATKKVSS